MVRETENNYTEAIKLCFRPVKIHHPQSTTCMQTGESDTISVSNIEEVQRKGSKTKFLHKLQLWHHHQVKGKLQQTDQMVILPMSPNINYNNRHIPTLYNHRLSPV